MGRGRARQGKASEANPVSDVRGNRLVVVKDGSLAHISQADHNRASRPACCGEGGTWGAPWLSQQAWMITYSWLAWVVMFCGLQVALGMAAGMKADAEKALKDMESEQELRVSDYRS